jgi:protein SCO1
LRKIALAAILAAAACWRPRAPEIVAMLPDFSMSAVDAQGESPFGLKDMAGRVWVADFIFTRCGGPCPVLSMRLSGLSRSLDPEVGLLSVTVDPEGDTPARLRDYARAYDADPRRWVFLRGSSADTYRLLYAGFRQPLSVDPKSPPEKRAVHSTRFVLVDKQGGIRGFYDGLSDEGNAALARDVRRLLEAGS